LRGAVLSVCGSIEYSCDLVLNATAQAHQEADEGDDQEYDEQYLGDAGRANRNAAESEKRRDQGDNEKYHSIMKHEHTYLGEERHSTPPYCARSGGL
jgi:hypothetical protein